MIPNPLRGALKSKSVQRGVSGIKILLDVANESSDWFPPLKSALGGLCALIKHYEQYKDVKEKVEQLVPWLMKLKNLTTVTTGIDPEEEAWRAELSSSLEEIEKQSQVLLEKKKFARALDKGGDSQIVADLVEQVRNAIVYYQISQQQSIYNQVRKLTSSVDTLLNLQERSPMTKRKIEAVLARLEKLGLGESDESTVGVQEFLQRAGLFTAFGQIKQKLCAVLARVKTVGYVGSGEDVQIVSDLADDIRDSIIDYQTAQQEAIYNSNLKLIDQAESLVLNGCRRARGAGYQHGSRTGCLNGTRECVLDEIERWTEDPDAFPVFWLNGLAGTGKTTIAQTISEWLFADDRLGASFFCSRGVEDRSDLQFIFPTLAFQLAQKYSDFRSHLVPILQANPDVVYEPLMGQMQKLLVEPLQSTGISTVIVIDALDECRDEDPESAILLVLEHSVSDIPDVKFFITSRPETHIMAGFRGELLEGSTNVFTLHNVEPGTINNDIRRFFKYELSKIARRRGGAEGWPTDEQVDSLCRRAAGFFVYAVATVNFLNPQFRYPWDQLDLIMKSPENTALEGGTKLRVYRSLDSLYTSILQESFCENEAVDDEMVRSVLGALVLATNPLPSSAIAKLMGHPRDQVQCLLEAIQSLLALPEDPTHTVQPFHKSFSDFITDPARCTDARFHVSPDQQTELVLRCLKLMDESLEKNMCSIPDYALNSEVKDLPKRIEDFGIRGALEYSCRSWYKHLTATKYRTTGVISALCGFLEKKFLFWLEVLSILGAVGDAASALNATLRWLNEIRGSADVKALPDLAADCLRFVTEFFEVISRSGPHIYHSALQLSPQSSVVRNLYGQHIRSPVSFVMGGAPASWDSCTASAGTTANVRNAIWSPCGKFIVANVGNRIEIRDSSTLERTSILESPNSCIRKIPGSLAVSPDGRLLACSYRHGRSLASTLIYCLGTTSSPLVVWDLQTGAILADIHAPDSGEVAFSGRTITLVTAKTFSTYNGFKGVQLCEGQLPLDLRHRSDVHPAHEESLRFATSSTRNGQFLINVWELRPTSTPSTLLVVSLPVSPHLGKLAFSPVPSHASFVTESEVVILDIRDSKVLLKTKAAGPLYTPPGCFSPDGCLFACGTSQGGILVWKRTPDVYIFWSDLRPRLPFKGFSFSPTRVSVLTWGPGGVELLYLDSGPNLPPSDETRPDHRGRDHLVSYSADRTTIATARREGAIVTILSTHSTTPQQFLDTGMEIQDINIVDNAIFVVDRCKLVSWRLNGGGMEYSVSVAEGAAVDETATVVARARHLTLSRDCSRIAFAVGESVFLYDVKARRIFDIHSAVGDVAGIRFSPDDCRLWFVHYLAIHKYYCVDFEGPLSGKVVQLHELGEMPPDAFFRSDSGCHIGPKTGWVSNSRGKLLWIPPSWRAENGFDMRWDGDFLALVSSRHPEPIIIKFPPTAVPPAPSVPKSFASIES